MEENEKVGSRHQKFGATEKSTHSFSALRLCCRRTFFTAPGSVKCFAYLLPTAGQQIAYDDPESTRQYTVQDIFGNCCWDGNTMNERTICRLPVELGLTSADRRSAAPSVVSLVERGISETVIIMHRKLKLAPSPTCPCGQEEQTTEHVLQRCPLHKATREDVWPVSTSLTTQRYGCKQELEKTTSFISRAALIV